MDLTLNCSCDVEEEKYQVVHVVWIKLILLLWPSSLQTCRSGCKSLCKQEETAHSQRKNKTVAFDSSPEKRSDCNNDKIRKPQFYENKSVNTYLMVQIRVFIFDLLQE